MAARRLIIVLVVLFAISIVAAMIAPDRRGTLLGDRSETGATTTTTSSTTTAADRLPSGAALSERIDASAARPESLEARVGDQLALAVSSDRARLVEVAELGVTADAVPDAPASFNLLLRDAGVLTVRDAETGAVLGRIEVAPARERGTE